MMTFSSFNGMHILVYDYKKKKNRECKNIKIKEKAMNFLNFSLSFKNALSKIQCRLSSTQMIVTNIYK